VSDAPASHSSVPGSGERGGDPPTSAAAASGPRLGQPARIDREGDHAERPGTLGGARGVIAGEQRGDACVELAGRVAERAPRRRAAVVAQPRGQHAPRRRALRTVPGARGLGRDAEQVAQLEVTRIDAVVSGAARSERREADDSTL
jgi:hypothetical protein